MTAILLCLLSTKLSYLNSGELAGATLLRSSLTTHLTLLQFIILENTIRAYVWVAQVSSLRNLCMVASGSGQHSQQPCRLCFIHEQQLSSIPGAETT